MTALLVLCLAPQLALAQSPPGSAAAPPHIAAAPADPNQPITLAADWCARWTEGPYEVWWLRGNCYFNQGLAYARGAEAAVWIQRGDAPAAPLKALVYFEGRGGQPVTVDFRRPGAVEGGEALAGRQQGPTWFGRFESRAELQLRLPTPDAQPAETPAICQRGQTHFDPARRRQVQLAQYNEFAPAVPGQGLPPGMRKFTLLSRSDSLGDIQWLQLPNGERAAVISGGVRLLVEGVSSAALPAEFGPLGVIDISTDRAVIWTAGVDPVAGGDSVQSQDAPLEFYLEGNIEFRQGDRVVYAERMYYDVRLQNGVILNAELLTPLPTIGDYRYPGLVRLKAGAIRQLNASQFVASNALVTTSRLEEPAYHFASNEIRFEDRQRTVVDPQTGLPVLDPTTQDVAVEHAQLAESRGNFLYLAGLPVFYWPTLATDLTKPSFFIDNVRVGNDSIFGTQVLVDWDAYQLFGISNAPQGTEWGLSTDLLTDRGIGLGTDFSWDRNSIFGFTGPARGYLDFWTIPDDQGLDNLGLGRRAIVPEESFRFRLRGEHRQRLENGWIVEAESGWLSDRTFLEQYYEQEWDEWRSPRTGLSFNRLTDNRSLSLEANAQVNDFFTETQWLPRLDHYWLGESLLGDRLTWFAHSQAAYADLNYAVPPTEPTLAAQFTSLPWEIGAGQSGERLITRQEIDLPLQIGPAKVVPYALGELARWGEALDGNSLDRAYVHTGVRASIPFWAVFPEVRDDLFNLHGLAHKVVFDAEFSYSDASRNYDELPLYDPLDDVSITEFRRRLYSPAIDPTIAPADLRYDPRFYAIRGGMQGWVTAPVAELAEDQMALRAGMRHRWQTKRGAPGNQHIVDWLTLDANVTWFPEADRDNFGQDFGLFDYDLRWHVGDRFTIISDGAADFFSDGLMTASIGALLNRPTRGNAYLGFRTINGPIESNVLTGSYSYLLSEKWIATAGSSVDFSSAGNIGQAFSITRVGESLLVSAGVNVDASKDNVGFRLLIEPRFLPKKRLTALTGIDVPPAGAFGLD